MNTTVLASLATLGLGTSSLLLTPGIAVADLTQAPQAELNAVNAQNAERHAVMGPAQDYQQGLTVNGVAPTLRSVVVDDQNILAYCIEYWIQAADPDHESAVTGWDGFTGDNHFKTDPEVREHVAWILRHSYPTLSLSEVAKHTGADELTAPEALSATQAAIWHFTDDFVPDGTLDIEDGPTVSVKPQSADNVQAVFDYLTGADNTGLTEQAVQASVTLEDATDPASEVPDAIAGSMRDTHDQLFGPIVLNSSTSAVNLDLRALPDTAVNIDDLTIIDGDGEPVDVQEPVAAGELWVYVPADVEAGGVNLSAESTEYGYTGRLIIPEPDGQRRFQTIVVVDQATDQASTDIELTWEQPVVDEPTEEPEPLQESPAVVETSPSEASVPEQPAAKPPAQEPTAAEPAAGEPVTEPITKEPEKPEPTAEESSTPDETASFVAESEPVEEPEPTERSTESPATAVPVPTEPTEQLAETGAHETRNVLIALGTIAVGAGLLLVNRLKRRRLLSTPGDLEDELERNRRIVASLTLR